jgi:hypothetical protein
MLRVRPGIELVLASFFPTRAFITLDFPTLDLPRNATSGNAGAGKWLESVAAIRNRERIRIRALQFRCIKPAPETCSSGIRSSAQPERPLVLHIFFPNWPELVPNKKHNSDSHPDAEADRKKPTVGRESDQQNRDHCNCNNQPGCASYRNTRMGLWIGLHIRHCKREGGQRVVTLRIYWCAAGPSEGGDGRGVIGCAVSVSTSAKGFGNGCSKARAST